jgi:hypothetical protein
MWFFRCRAGFSYRRLADLFCGLEGAVCSGALTGDCGGNRNGLELIRFIRTLDYRKTTPLMDCCSDGIRNR